MSNLVIEVTEIEEKNGHEDLGIVETLILSQEAHMPSTKVERTVLGVKFLSAEVSERYVDNNIENVCLKMIKKYLQMFKDNSGRYCIHIARSGKDIGVRR